MKMKKTIALLLCAVLLVAGSVMGTLAYLTDNDSVTNTFTVGEVDITLDEAKVKLDGSVDGTERVNENKYHLLPGHQYTKDPTVTVASGSEDCYLFVKVVNEIADIEDKSNTVAAQMEENGWAKVSETADGSLYVYGTVADPTAVKGGENKTVFTTFKIDGDVTNGTLAGYAGKTIVVTAYAVQTDGFENETAEAIWGEAFGT